MEGIAPGKAAKLRLLRHVLRRWLSRRSGPGARSEL